MLFNYIFYRINLMILVCFHFQPTIKYLSIIVILITVHLILEEHFILLGLTLLHSMIYKLIIALQKMEEEYIQMAIMIFIFII